VFYISSSPGPQRIFFAVFRDRHRRCEQFLLRSKWMIRSAGPLQPRDHRRWRARLKHYGMGHGNLRFHSRRTVRVRVKSQNLSQSGQQGQDEEEKKIYIYIKHPRRVEIYIVFLPLYLPSSSVLFLVETSSQQDCFSTIALSTWSIGALQHFYSFVLYPKLDILLFG
jgi:hypothetical protein